MENETTLMTSPSPVRYYVGDLCYVMAPEWGEVCDLTFSGDNTEVNGKLQLADGRKFAIFGTAYGDGGYLDQKGNSYCVDSGTLGIIKVDDIRDPEFSQERALSLGNIVEFEEEFDALVCESDDGVIQFGHIVIDTKSENDYDDEDEEFDEDEDA
jgi:hypothetical protein